MALRVGSGQGGERGVEVIRAHLYITLTLNNYTVMYGGRPPVSRTGEKRAVRARPGTVERRPVRTVGSTLLQASWAEESNRATFMESAGGSQRWFAPC